MPAPNVPNDIMDRLASLEAQVRDLSGRVNIRPALSEIQGGDVTISQGGRLIVKNAAGGNTLYVGKVSPSHPDGSDQQGLLVYREDGTIALAVWTQAGSGVQPIQVYDKNSKIIFADDLTGGGLARPYVACSAWFGATETPTHTTNSGTFTTLEHLDWIKQHPQVNAHYLVQTSAGTTGEIRLVDDSNVVIVGPLSVPAASFYWASATGPLAGAHMLSTTLHWQARVTGGTGSIGVKGLSTYGMQS
jgi:hypothetical protein